MMENFSKTLIAWYEVNKRDFPWRNTQNPYYICLSEIIKNEEQVTTIMNHIKESREIKYIPDIKRTYNSS